MRFLITMPPLCGHLFPIVPLAWALRSAGHDVLVATPQNFTGTIAEAGLPVADGVLPEIGFQQFMLHDRKGDPIPQPRDPAERRASSGRAWGRLSAYTLDGVKSIVEGWKPDVIIADRTDYAGPMVAAHYGLPWIEHGWGVSDVVEYRPAAAAELAPELERLGLDGIPSPNLVLESGPRSMVPDEGSGRGLDRVLMRFVPYCNRAVVPPWAMAEHDKPRICVTLGSILPSHGRRDFAGGMAHLMEELPKRTGAEVIVAVDDEVAERWKPLPEGVLAAGWMALPSVLPACDLVVHHGGPGSMFAGLVAGLPQLVLPQTGDQFANADRIASLGAALQLVRERVDGPEVVEACAELLSDPLYRKRAEELGRENATQPSPNEVVPVLERIGAGAVAAGNR
jgi:UDP:flavonoid glycosyltransferase YjiC (YdhE family)